MPVVLLFAALIISGLSNYFKLPVKYYPNVIIPEINVSISQSGASPAEIEGRVTTVVENAVASVSGVKQIRSNVSLGLSSTIIEFELSTDMQKATEDVRSAIDRARPQLPSTIDPPQVQRLDIDSAPILTYAVASKTLSGADISWFIDDTVARDLQAEKGVAQVTRVGGSDREINVILDPNEMAAFGVTAPQINDALRQFNTDEPGGRADIGGQEQTVRILGSAMTVDRLRETEIPVAGHAVRLSNLAQIGDGEAEQRGFARLNGKPCVGFQVDKTKDSSEVEVEARVVKAVDKLARNHPEVQVTKVISTVEETRSSFSATQHVLLEGMGLASLVVFFFLKDWRATTITALAMPLSLIPTFLVMRMLGISLNVVTLLALTLVIGILVDDAIVEVENIQKRVETGQSPYRAALIGADSIGLAVIATTSTIAAVFLPVSFMPGVSGQFFKEFGLTVSVAVFFSLLVARFATPPMAAYFLKAKHDPQHSKPLGGFYKAALDWALGHRWISVALGCLAFFCSIPLVCLLPTGFQPISDDGYFYVQVEGPPGVTRGNMEVAVQDVTQRLRRHAEVNTVFAQVGSTGTNSLGDGFGGELRQAVITVTLKPQRLITTQNFKRLIRPELGSVPDVRISTQSTFGASDVNIVLRGADPALLDRLGMELEQEMRGLPQVANIRSSPPPPGRDLVVTLRSDEAARLGINTVTIANVLRTATIGEIDANVAKYTDGERRLPIRARLAEDKRIDLDAIKQLRVATQSGKVAPLSAFANVTLQAGPTNIVRYARQREVVIEADLNGATLGQALGAIRTLPAMRHLPPGVTPANFGDAEAMAELFAGATSAFMAGIGLIYGVLILLFHSFFKPAIILAALPLCLIGAVVGLLLGRMEIDMPAIIGLLMLMGLAAKNSILLVEFAIKDERAGQLRLEAIRNACRERVRPIVMTTFAMAAGMLPTALGLGPGAEFRQPMAIAVIGGLVSSTTLSLVLIPVIYEIVDDLERWLSPKLGRLVTPKAPGDYDHTPSVLERDSNKSISTL